jgi:hypothetical protein
MGARRPGASRENTPKFPMREDPNPIDMDPCAIGASSNPSNNDPLVSM